MAEASKKTAASRALPFLKLFAKSKQLSMVLFVVAKNSIGIYYMLLTKASEYALLSILCISEKKDPIDVENLSTSLMISRSFLAKILQKLTKAGILNSFKGVKGGFVLAKKVEDISVLDIIRALIS